MTSMADLRLNLASIYLDDALHWRSVCLVEGEKEMRLYTLFKHDLSRLLILVCVLIFVGLTVMEENAWPFWLTSLLEMTCLAVFLTHLLAELFITRADAGFWRDAKHVGLAFIVALSALDLFVFTVQLEYLGSHSSHRWTRVLRPLVLVNLTEFRQVRQAVRNVRKTLPQILNALLLFLVSLLLFALVARKLFGAERSHLTCSMTHKPYFESYSDALWQLYVLVTTANHPDVMTPAYNRSRWAALFFVVFLIVNLYMFMSVFLAVVYNQFRDNLREEVRNERRRERLQLERIFELTSDCSSSGPRLYENAFVSLVKLTLPSMPASYAHLTWLVLDTERRGFLLRSDLDHLLELLRLRVVDTSSLNAWQRWMPRVYAHPLSHLLISVTKCKLFRYFFDAVILLNAIYIALDVSTGMETLFVTLFTMEILMKMYAFGFVAFFAKMWNVFDTVVVGSAVVLTAMTALVADEMFVKEAVDMLMVLRVIRIFKVFHSMSRFRTVLNTLVHVLPSFATYSALLFVVFYVFGVVGVDLFGGLIDDDGDVCGNEALRDTLFVKHEYCKNNFNSLLSAFVLLFELMVVNQWHVLADGFVAVSSEWARLYFIAFHVVCVIVILNIFTAFVLEVFVLEFKAAPKPLRSVLAQRLTSMRLVLGDVYGKQSQTTTNSSFGLFHNDLFDAFDSNNLDADHDNFVEEKNDENGGHSGPDLSHSTTLRFHLKPKSRSAAALVESLFQDELQQ